MKITAIRSIPQQEKHYDITVATDHNFFANGILTHNCNTSAVNAIIVGVNRGLNPVDELDIIQEAGRAGRFGMAPYGNVYLICDNPREWEDKIRNPKNVESQLLDTYALSFHLCAEIRNRIVTNYDTMYLWYQRTLASIQKPLTTEHIDEVLSQLQNWNAVRVLEDKTFEITALGKVAATLYFHPHDCYHWASSFKHIAQNNLWNYDHCLAYALAAPTAQLPYIPRSEMDDVLDFTNQIRSVWGRSGPPLKANTLARDLYELLQGKKPTPQCRPLQLDAERITGAISWISGIFRIEKPEFLKILPIRMRYGCSRELAVLCQLPGIGAVKAKKLAVMGITTLMDVIKNPTKVKSVVGEKGLKKTIDTARLLLRRDTQEETVSY